MCASHTKGSEMLGGGPLAVQVLCEGTDTCPAHRRCMPGFEGWENLEALACKWL